MSEQNKRKYLNHADIIPYAPNINLFNLGGDILSGLKESKSVMSGIAASAKGLGEMLSDGATQAAAERQRDLAKELAAFRLSNELFALSLALLAQNKQQRMQQWALLSQPPTESNYGYSFSLEPSKTNLFLLGGLISAGMSLGKGISSAMSNGYSNGVSNVMSKIPGVRIFSGIAARLGGVRANDAKLQEVDTTKAALTGAADAASMATSLDDSALMSPKAFSLDMANAYKGSGFGKKKARRKNEALRLELILSQETASRARESGVLNILSNQNAMLESLYYAYGGNMIPMSEGAIGYAFMNDYLHNGYLSATRDNKLEALNSNLALGALNNSIFAEGGHVTKLKDNYQEGSIYNIDENEYKKLLDAGYQIEVINS